MRILETERDPIAEIKAALTFDPVLQDPDLKRTVHGIINDVRKRGDEALVELGRRFDSPQMQSLVVDEKEFADAYAVVNASLVSAIRAAKNNIEAFHRRQVQNSWISSCEDFTYGQIVRPIERVGIYAPGGLSPYPSTVLMTAVPASVAGVPELVMCAPAQADGTTHPAMLVAAQECGVSKVFRVGGAQAVAAMAFGTQTIPKVDKIVGPGNAYVTEAKRQLFGIVGIDQLAGPSEILVIADESANPEYVAADLLSQAEHGPESRCVLITISRKLADSVIKELKRQTEQAIRADYIQASLNRFGIIVIAGSLEECAELANTFAPEHLELCVEQPWELLRHIKNAGTIMVGHYTPVPLCDFAAGPNHTLPTGGTARFSSALSVDDFVKKSGLLAYTKQGVQRISETALEIAGAEGFQAHGRAISVRLN